MKARSIGLLAFCNGHQVVLDSLNKTVDGLFKVYTKSKSLNGITLYSPRIKNISDKELEFL